MKARFIDPGRVRTQLSLEAVTRSPAGLGGHAETWGEVASVMADLVPARADTRFGAGQRLETMTHDVTLRFRADVASGMRLRLGARSFDILTVHDPDETGRYLVCRTREIGR